MNKQLRLVITGMLTIIPFLVSVAFVWWLAQKLGWLGYVLLEAVLETAKPEWADMVKDKAHSGYLEPLLALGGAVLVIFGIYLIGLLMHFYLFRRLLFLMERLFQTVPGVKTIYESVRDLLKLFGGDAKSMGKVVLYRPNGGDMAILGILTNEYPLGLVSLGDHQMVALYLPLAFMVGGPIVYVPRKDLQEIDLPVEVALKLCATAEITKGLPIKPLDECKCDK